MSSWESIMWQGGEVKVVGFTTAGRKGSTTVKVELAVTNPYALGDLVRDLAQLRDAKPAPKAEGMADV